jgi:hypothetical protein
MNERISLAQWALVEEVRAGKWKTTDFARIARDDFGLSGIEYVNTLMEVPTEEYLKRLKKAAADHDVANVLIMVDDEGDGCSHLPEERRQFIINHTKWVDAAAYLGCHAIRTNCRGTEAAKHAGHRQTIAWAVESYIPLIEYAASANICILIENHGGLSNDADWMTDLMLEIDHPFFGTYPDWREPSHEFDNRRYLEKMLPFAKGMSYRNQPTDALSAQMIALCERAGYEGWSGIESSGREEVAKGIRLLQKIS